MAVAMGVVIDWRSAVDISQGEQSPPAFSIGFQIGSLNGDASHPPPADFHQAMDTGRVTLLALLDVSAAFDTVDFDILIQRLSKSFHGSTHSFTNVPPRYRLGQRAHRGFRSSTVSLKAPVWAHSCIFCIQQIYRMFAEKLVLQPICTRMTFSLTCMSSHSSRYRQFNQR